MATISATSNFTKEEIQKYNQLIIDYPNGLKFIEAFRKRFPCLEECDCTATKRSYRMILEIELITQVNENFKDKKAPFSVVSFGSGGCFEELNVLARLLKEGYENIEFTLIDTRYEKSGEIPKEVEDFIETVLLLQYPQAKVNIKYATKVDKYVSNLTEKTIPNVFLLVDLQCEKSSEGPSPKPSIIDYCLSELSKQRKLFDKSNSLIAFTNYKDVENATLGDMVTTCNVLPINYCLFPLFKKTLTSHCPESSFGNIKKGCALSVFERSKGGITYKLTD